MKMTPMAFAALLAFAGAAFAQDTTAVDTTMTDTTMTDTTATDSTSDSTTAVRYANRSAADVLEIRASATGMRFAVKEADRPVTFRILDVTGRQLWGGRAVSRDGIASLDWSGAGTSGQSLNAGVYIVQAVARERGRDVSLMQRQFLFRP